MKELVIKVWGSNTYKRTYFNTVSVDGVNMITPWGAAGNSWKNVIVLAVEGGYTRGDSSHAWEAEYTLRIRCLDDAKIEARGRQLNGSSGYKVISEKVVEHA
jgi:hypothetical protein